MTKIQSEISTLESRLNDLRALRQLIVHHLHKIAKDNFEEEFERRILHTIMNETPQSVSELANILKERPLRVRNTLNRMNKKIYGNKYDQKTLFTEIQNK